MSRRRVVVTGIGAVSPLGLDAASSWRGVVDGRSGIGKITRFNTDSFPVRIGGEVEGFDPETVASAKDARHMDRFVHFALAAGIEAVTDAGLTDSEPDCEKIGVSIGSGIGGIEKIEDCQENFLKHGARRISPFFVPSTIINIAGGYLSMRFNFQGPNFALVSACTTGTHCIGNSARLIQAGDAEAMVCGGAEAAITPLAVGSFGTARALSRNNDNPQEASCPFDKKRDGFVLGEGAGALVLEEEGRARKRGAKIYARLAGYGMSADAHHITAPREDAKGAIACMRSALQDAQVDAPLPPEAIGYINAHGTSTPLGDTAETRAIKSVFGARAGEVFVSSTKSMIGHLLGAAGGIEAVFCALALADGVAPPTINLRDPDPECDLDYVANESRPIKLRAAMSNSFGFGGANATLLFAKA